MNKKLQAHSAIFFANTIFGLGVPVTKLLLDEWVTPMGYMATRSLGACLVFWLIAAFLPKEHVERKDLITILAGGLLGFVISQTLTAWALDYTSPVYFSLIATLTPVAVMLCAALTIGEKITSMKFLGVYFASMEEESGKVVRGQRFGRMFGLSTFFRAPDSLV